MLLWTIIVPRPGEDGLAVRGGLPQKRVLGNCHPALERLSPLYSTRVPESTISSHGERLQGRCVEITSHLALFETSIFAM